MKKNTLFATIILAGMLAKGQVGINTQNPQGIFHVDGAKDNPTTGAPSVSQQANDVAVTADGRLGMGTTTPQSKLHVFTPSGSALQLQDGTQGSGKVLMSDANGKASWTNNVAITPTVLGILNTTQKVVTTNSNIGSSLTLSQGKWLINIGLLATSNVLSTTTYNLWMRLSLSSSNTVLSTSGFSFMASKYVSGFSSGLQAGDYSLGKFSMMTGTIPVNVTSNVPITLYLWFGECTPGHDGAPTVEIGNNGENYLFATPMN